MDVKETIWIFISCLLLCNTFVLGAKQEASLSPIIIAFGGQVGNITSSYQPTNNSTKMDYYTLAAKDKQTIHQAELRVPEMRRINPFRAVLGRPKISPLYLINGTVCRFVNFQPVCTTLSTTGLSVDGGGSAARPASGGSSSGGGGSSGGASGGGGGGSSSGSSSSGSRPTGSAGVSGGSSGGSTGRPSSSSSMSGTASSVQFVNQQPPRASAVVQEDRPELYAERIENSTESQVVSGLSENGQQFSQEAQVSGARPIGVIVGRRPGLLPLLGRRPTLHYQLVSKRSETLKDLSKTRIQSSKKVQL